MILRLLIRMRRLLLKPIKMQSEIKDVVYINFLVDINKIDKTLLMKFPIININGKTIFTILTYNHGNFRPIILHFLKKFFPSPLQSNWRFYTNEKKQSILFHKNILDSKLLTIGSKIMSDAMNASYCHNFVHNREADTISTIIESQRVDLKTKVTEAQNFKFDEELFTYFKSEEAILSFICKQDYAYNKLDEEHLCKSKISLNFHPEELIPLKIDSFESKYIRQMFGEVKPFAFLMPEVVLKTLDEKLRLLTRDTKFII